MVASSRGILAIGLSLAGLASWSVRRSVKATARWLGPQNGEPLDKAHCPHRSPGDRHGRHRTRLQELREGQGFEQGVQRGCCWPGKMS